MQHLKRFRKISSEKAQAYFKSSTLHGVAYFSCENHWTVFAIWSVILLSSLSLCAFLCNMIWIKFTTDPTFTVVESTHYSTKKVPFPAIAVCDPMVVYGPLTHNITDILRRRSFSDDQIYAFYDSFSKVSKIEYDPPKYISKMHKVLGELGFTLHKLLNLIAKPCHILIESCLWRDHKHNCTQMFHRVYTVVGYCCLFDMQYFKRNADPRTNFVAGVDYSEALSIIVNGVEISFNGSSNDGYVHLYVYDSTSDITLMTSPTVITPSGFFDVSILLWVIESSLDVHTLSLASRKCVLDSELITHGGKYTYYDDCMTKLILKIAANFCRCLPFQYRAELQSNIKDIISGNECWQKCDSVQYNTQIDYIKNAQPVTIFGSSSVVSVHYIGTTCLKYRREIIYTWDQMLANIGGIFGLCLGGSIISILELLWFCGDLVRSLIKETRKRKTTPMKKNIFTVSGKKFINNSFDSNSSKSPKNGAKFRFVH